MNGWVKLHKKTLENEVYRFDPTAWRIFLHLLLVCDYKSGVWKGGIKQLAGSLDMPKTTAYEAIKRLADRNMVVCKPNALYTAYHICKWSEYQYETERRPFRDRSVTVHKPTLLKNKEVRSKKEYKNTLVEVEATYDLYLQVFNKDRNKYKLTDKRKSKLKARLKDAGREMLEQAIRNTAASKFHTGDNDRGWSADLDFIIRSYEQVEKLAHENLGESVVVDVRSSNWKEVL